MLTLTYFAWEFFLPSFQSGETSSNTGGLILWPVKFLMPLGFALVLLQGVSELIKRIAGLRGYADEPSSTRSRCSERAVSGSTLMLDYGYIAPAMFAGLIVFMLIGFPVAFSLSALGLAFGLLAIEVGYFGPEFLQALPYRIFGIMSNELLLAIPFFTFSGAILEKSGLAEDLLEGAGQLFGAVPGRPRLRGDLRRRHPRRGHRHGRGLGHRHGDDLAAGDAASTATTCASAPA